MGNKMFLVSKVSRMVAYRLKKCENLYSSKYEHTILVGQNGFKHIIGKSHWGSAFKGTNGYLVSLMFPEWTFDQFKEACIAICETEWEDPEQDLTEVLCRVYSKHTGSVVVCDFDCMRV